MTALAIETNQQRIFSSILQRIAGKDQTAVKDCVDTYGNFIWSLARKFTHSIEEAEITTREIFIDIWQYSEPEYKTQSFEKIVISRIALRRLIKCLQLKPRGDLSFP